MSPLVTDRSPTDTDAPADPDLPWSLIETAPYVVDADDPDEPTGTPVEADRGGSRRASIARRLLRDRRSWVALPLLTVFVALAIISRTADVVFGVPVVLGGLVFDAIQRQDRACWFPPSR